MQIMIGTWSMCYPGLQMALNVLNAGGDAGEAVVTAIGQVEGDPAFSSVGLGGLPARDGVVRLDAGYMDGNTLRCGAVMSCEKLLHPIQAARLLCGRETNWMLCGPGADAFGLSMNLETGNLLTEKARKRWETETQTEGHVYRGHDTVCVLCLDRKGHMVAGTSTSGLFMKEQGRVGDSPIPGSGFYCDAALGACAATGLGEDIMRGVLSYACVQAMRTLSAGEACRQVLSDFVRRRESLGEAPGHISLIALSARGETGAATTEDAFPFAVLREQEVSLYVCTPSDITQVDPLTYGISD